MEEFEEEYAILRELEEQTECTNENKSNLIQ